VRIVAKVIVLQVVMVVAGRTGRKTVMRVAGRTGRKTVMRVAGRTGKKGSEDVGRQNCTVIRENCC
jgi:hypothetical protein